MQNSFIKGAKAYFKTKFSNEWHKRHPPEDTNSKRLQMKVVTLKCVIPFSHKPPTLQSKTVRHSSGLHCWPGLYAAAEGPGQMPADYTNNHTILLNKCQLPLLLFQHLCTVAENEESLTFRKVALSLVTMDGLTLMLSCIINVKLQSRHKEGEKFRNLVYKNKKKKSSGSKQRVCKDK